MTTNHLDSSEVNSYDYLIVGGGTAVGQVSSKVITGIQHMFPSWQNFNLDLEVTVLISSDMTGLRHCVSSRGISATEEDPFDRGWT
jgi:hypothetical protein